MGSSRVRFDGILPEQRPVQVRGGLPGLIHSVGRVATITVCYGKNVAKAFEELVLFRWGTPDYLLTDNGKEFDNKDLGGILEVYGVTRVTIPPYHPQANPVERSNLTPKTMITTFVKADHQSWDQRLHELRHAMNTASQSSMRVSPAFLNYGRHPSPVKSLRREVEQKGPKTLIATEIWIDRVKRLDALREEPGASPPKAGQILQQGPQRRLVPGGRHGYA